MDSVSKRRTDIVCFIVGSGGKKKELISLINHLDVNNFVKLVGSKPHNEIPIWMNACDIFVLPSLKESFGIVQIEAMACGKAVVATINGGSEEIVVNDNLGILVEPKNAEVLAEAIMNALDFEWDEEYIHDYAEQYTWHKMAENIGGIYNSL